MSRCPKCGEELKADAIFCPNCGFKVKSDDVSYEKMIADDGGYDKMIADVIYVDGRISKAKSIGVAIFLLYIFANMFFVFPSMLRSSFLLFLGAVIVVFLIGLFYYCVCRGIGFVVRRFVN